MLKSLAKRSSTLRRAQRFKGLLINILSTLDWDELVFIYNVFSFSREAVKSIIVARLEHLVSPFVDDMWELMVLLFSTGGVLVGDIPHRLTQTWSSVYDPTLHSCLVTHSMSIVVPERKDMLLVMWYFKRRGYLVWRGTHVKDGGLTKDTDFLVGARTAGDLLLGRPVTIAYGDGIIGSTMPCAQSKYISIVTPARIYKTPVPAWDPAVDAKARLQWISWTHKYERDPPSFKYHAVREALRPVSRRHECWNPKCTRWSDYFAGGKFGWIYVRQILVNPESYADGQVNYDISRGYLDHREGLYPS
ncbi:hypothetical protein NMY22_g6838 [Coprinellus aureogranulatus]|nr:hypothetical protein NMY22_g6838 [Coprinellus aureogranulatus]